ncbi:MAG: putative sensor domain DACNV-containing protein [Janthinobacterium lividum]
MHSEPTYLAARMVAPELAAHFASYRAAALSRGTQPLPPAPSAALIEAVIDIAFWASLRREEGRPPRISLTLLDPADTAQPLIFGQRLRLTPHSLTKLAPAVEHPGIHLGVGYEPADESLYVWGTVSEVPPVGFVLEVVEPGLLAIKHRRADGFGKFVNVAVLRGDLVKLVDEDNAGLAELPALRDSLPPVPDPLAPVVVLVELGRAMRAHGRGGLVLLVPTGSEIWRASVVQPLSYPVEPPYRGVAEQLAAPGRHAGRDWQAELLRHIEVIGGFTAVDGATVLNRAHELLAFGVKVTRRADSLPVEEMILTEPVLGSTPQRLHPAKAGGTRHLAAAQFVHDQHDAVALVASQDGNFTVFTWSAALGLVHAHRIDVLLV